MDEITKKAFRKNIGRQIQKLRKDAGFSSAKAFAESVGFNPNTYTQYEQGISGFNYEQAWVMADALECSMDELGGREWPPEGGGAQSPDEAELVGCYRAANGVFQDEILDYARRTAEKHPKSDSLASDSPAERTA